jgi:PAS domain-containing protein
MVAFGVEAPKTNGQARDPERRLVTWYVYKRTGSAALPELHALVT